MPASVGTERMPSGPSPAQRQQLLALARASIEYGARYGEPPPVAADLPPWLLAPAASFVTLTLRPVGANLTDADERLRGCIGSLQAWRPLAEDVSENAYAAAFRDPRFPPVRFDELAQLRIELSVLSPLQPLPPVQSDSELLANLLPGRDGVVVVQQGRRATFLPKVWSHFAEPAEFLSALRQKAGLSPDFDPAAQYQLYQVETFAEA